MKILLIENDNNYRSFLKNSLENEDYIVDSVNNGREGLFLASTSSYQIIISSLNLPAKNGMDLCKEIRNKNILIPIIIISYNNDLSTKKELYEIGIDDYITKPFAYSELLARIKAILRRPISIAKKPITVNDLEINLNNNIVKRKNQMIPLTKKEFKLLEFFIHNPDTILTRTYISEKIWDINADPFSHSIETHISNLRKKINRGFDKKYISTVFGKGYKFEI